MNEQCDRQDRQWRILLTRCHGGEVAADAAFKSGLLDKLRKKTAENRIAAEDDKWRMLLTAAYAPCVPGADFRDRLLDKLKARQARIAGTKSSTADDETLQTILSASYTPVQPRREFQTRLLESLKERQRSTVVVRRNSRTRTLFMSAASGIAAAAMVMFTMWVMPAGNEMPAEPVPAEVTGGVTPLSGVMTAPSSEVAATILSPSPASGTLRPESVIPAAFPGDNSPSYNYRVADAFAGASLPGTARGIGMEVNDGDGWRAMDASLAAAIVPGMSFRRSRRFAESPGLGFGDGSIMNFTNDAVIEATGDGFAVRSGTVAINVPEHSESRFRLHFPERDLAIEPGSELLVMVPSSDNYADGNGPAPWVMLEQGLALARGKHGTGPIFANQVYQIDRYASPDLPGRAPCQNDLRRFETVRSGANSLASFASAGPGNAVAVPNNTRTTYFYAPAGYAKKDSRWYAESYAGGPTVKVKYLSDDYFGLANARRDLAPALALGSQVIIDGGDGVFYEIHK